MKNIEIVSVNVGQPQLLGVRKDTPVWSGIDKRPVNDGQLLLTYTNLAGDQQVDTKPKGDGRQLHGGNEMAVYAYPAEHFGAWNEELGPRVPTGLIAAIGPGTLGENLTIRGAVETEVCIGDKWRWGQALLEVSKPRGPCYKLNMKIGTDMIRRMRANGHCGWYLRVLEPGMVPTSGQIEVVYQATEGITVAERFAQKNRQAAEAT